MCVKLEHIGGSPLNHLEWSLELIRLQMFFQTLADRRKLCCLSWSKSVAGKRLTNRAMLNTIKIESDEGYYPSAS